MLHLCAGPVAAVHDGRDKEGTRHDTGHVFLLNLRRQAMCHLDLCDPITRPKSNTALMRCGFLPFDKEAPVNAGVISDEQAAPAATTKMIRRSTWQDPDTGEVWQFLTNEPAGAR